MKGSGQDLNEKKIKMGQDDWGGRIVQTLSAPEGKRLKKEREKTNDRCTGKSVGGHLENCRKKIGPTFLRGKIHREKKKHTAKGKKGNTEETTK